MPGHLELARQRPAARAALAELERTALLRAALGVFRKERKWINDKHLELCRIPAPTFLELRRAEWLAAQLRELGWDAKLDRAGNVTATHGGAKDSPLVALTAHLDTVLSPRNPESDIKFDAAGRLVGPGVSDNGAGLAALLAVARAVAQAPGPLCPDAGLLLVATVGEEGEGNLSGMRHLCKDSSLAARIRAYLVLDGPHIEHVTADALACRRFEVSIQAPGGHSWSDHGLPNANHALSRALARFLETCPAEPPVRSSYNVGILEGGSSINAIASQARAKIDLRSQDSAYLDEMARRLASAVEAGLAAENASATNGRASGKLRETGFRPGGRLDAASPLLAHLAEVDRHLGIVSHPDCASTDANIPISMGLQAVSIGAGGSGGGAHTPAEWYHPEGRELGLRRILLTLALLLPDAAP